jgi:hypothetical protein
MARLTVNEFWPVQFLCRSTISAKAAHHPLVDKLVRRKNCQVPTGVAVDLFDHRVKVRQGRASNGNVRLGSWSCENARWKG